MGGPESEEEVHPYLKELFQDKELLKLRFKKFLVISSLEEPLIQKRYEELGQYCLVKSWKNKADRSHCNSIEFVPKLLHTNVFQAFGMPNPERGRIESTQ